MEHDKPYILVYELRKFMVGRELGAYRTQEMEIECGI